MDNLFFFSFSFFLFTSFVRFILLIFICFFECFWCVCPLGLVIETKEEVGVCSLILALDVRPGYCSSVMYIWWTCASCVCVCSSMFGFWKKYGPVVGARSPVRGTSAVVRTPVCQYTTLVPDRSFILRALGSACEKYIILPVLLSVPSPS